MKVFFAFIVGWVLTFGDVFAQSSSAFQSLEISDEIFARIEGKSFKKECTTPRKDLRYLRVLHYQNIGRRPQQRGFAKDKFDAKNYRQPRKYWRLYIPNGNT